MQNKHKIFKIVCLIIGIGLLVFGIFHKNVWVFGENNDFIVYTMEGTEWENRPIDIIIEDKVSKEKSIIKNVQSSGAVDVLNHAAKKIVLISYGTSNIRDAHIYYFPEGEEIDSFCHKGNLAFNYDTVVYADCTEKNGMLDYRQWENGEREPAIIRLDLPSNSKEVLKASDDTHTYSIKEVKDNKLFLTEDSVQKVEDWLDTKNIKTKELIINL